MGGFVLRFALAFALLEGLVYFVLYRDTWFEPYAALNARVCAWVLAPFVEGVRASGAYLHASTFALDIRPGCDSYQSSAVLLAGIAAFPAPLRRKLVGVAAGVTILLLLNFARLGTMLLVCVRWPKAFDTLHLEVMPAILLFAALSLWLAWALWARAELARGGEGPVAPERSPARS